MKKDHALMLVVAGTVLAFMVTACGPKGGVVILDNQSSYALQNAYISFGSSKVDSLAPGQWMKASIDKNALVEVHFFGGAASDHTAKDNIVVNGIYGSWSAVLGRDRWNSSGTSVNDGDTIVVIVSNR
ncbi:MAG: hypothetical protein LBD48_13415 [Treponema sp.]|jgi:hypothetical protein|nr:hypothetical protein [Treponema sp.]